MDRGIHMKKNYWVALFFTIVFISGCNNSAVNINDKILDDKKSVKISHYNENENNNDNIEINAAENKTTTSYSNEDKEKTQDKTDKAVSGLLLGLKKRANSDHEPTKYETLWIAQDNENIIVRRGKGFLSVPYGEEFYKIHSTIYDDKKFSPEAEEKSEEAPLYNYEHKFHFIDTIAYPFGNNPTEIYKEKVSWGDGEWPIRTSKDEVLFVGNKYILINKNYFETGGGTYRASGYSNSLYELKHLGEEYKKNSVDLNDFLDIDKDKINNYKNEHNMNLNDDKELNELIKYRQEVSNENILVTRKNGHWIAVLPIEKKFAHEGNGSMHITATDYLELTEKVSSKLLCYDDLIIPFETVKRQIPEARDVVSSPNGSMLVVLVKDRIDIYLYKDDTAQLKKADYSIRISRDQSIVSNQWATDQYVEKWDNTLKYYLVTDNIN